MEKGGLQFISGKYAVYLLDSCTHSEYVLVTVVTEVGHLNHCLHWYMKAVVGKTIQ